MIHRNMMIESYKMPHHLILLVNKFETYLLFRATYVTSLFRHNSWRVGIILVYQNHIYPSGI